MAVMAAVPKEPFGEGASQVAEPVDRIHLAEQTMGNRSLEREVLQIFLRQSATILDELSRPGAARADLAHKLLGSARGIGAPAVAEAAADLEMAARADPAGDDGELAHLREAVAEANAFIEGMLAE